MDIKDKIIRIYYELKDWVLHPIETYKFKKRMKELREKDPFIYK